MIPTMLPINETAKRTGLAKYYLRRGCLEGKIVHIRAGNKILINLDKLVDYLNTSTGEESKIQEAHEQLVRLIS